MATRSKRRRIITKDDPAQKARRPPLPLHYLAVTCSCMPMASQPMNLHPCSEPLSLPMNLLAHTCPCAGPQAAALEEFLFGAREDPTGVFSKRDESDDDDLTLADLVHKARDGVQEGARSHTGAIHRPRHAQEAAAALSRSPCVPPQDHQALIHKPSR